MKKLLKKGFTLLELLIVIVIMGLLVSLVSINLFPTLNNAYIEVAKTDIKKLEQAGGGTKRYLYHDTSLSKLYLFSMAALRTAES